MLVPGVGMFSFGKDKQTARVAGEFYVNAINVMRGAESVSTYQPISEAEKFAICCRRRCARSAEPAFPRCGHGQHQAGSTSKIGPPS